MFRIILLFLLGGCSVLSPKTLIGVSPIAGDSRSTDRLIVALAAMPGLMVVDLGSQARGFAAWRGTKLRIDTARDPMLPCIRSEITRFEDGQRTHGSGQCIARDPAEASRDFIERYATMLYRTVIRPESRVESATFDPNG